MSIRHLLTGALALAAACSNSPSQPQLQFSDVRVSALLNAPGDAACIEVVAASPSRTVSSTFDVVAGQPTDGLVMSGIPTGNVLFSGLAFNAACASVTSATVATWVADNVSVKVSKGAAAAVHLSFHGNASATVGADFTGDDYTVTTIAGVGGTQGNTDGVGAGALFAGPNGAALSADGNTLYVDDRNTDPVTGAALGMTIRAVDLATGKVTTLAGSPTAVGTDDGPGASARFSRLFSVALSGSNLLIADRCAIRSMSTVAPYSVTTLVGTRNATNPAVWNCSPATTPLSTTDYDLAVRGSNVYVADSGHALVQKVDFSVSPPAITTVAGITDTAGFVDGPVATAEFAGPTGLVFPFVGDNIFYVIDEDLGSGGSTFTNVIRRVALSANSVTTVAGGTQSSVVSVDGIGTQARFGQPRRSVSDGNNLFIGDWSSVRRMDLATGAVITLAGDGTTSGFADGVGTAARFNAAFGIARDPRTGVLYIADQGNFAIRKLTPP